MSITGLEPDLTEMDWRRAAEGEHLLARTSLNLSASADALRIDGLQLSNIRLTMPAREGMFTTNEWQMTSLIAAETQCRQAGRDGICHTTWSRPAHRLLARTKSRMSP